MNTKQVNKQRVTDIIHWYVRCLLKNLPVDINKNVATSAKHPPGLQKTGRSPPVHII